MRHALIISLAVSLGLPWGQCWAAKPQAKAITDRALSDEIGIKLAVVGWHIAHDEIARSKGVYLWDRTPTGKSSIKKLVAEAVHKFPDLTFFKHGDGEKITDFTEAGKPVLYIEILDVEWDSKVEVDVSTRSSHGNSGGGTMGFTLKKVGDQWKVVDSRMTSIS